MTEALAIVDHTDERVYEAELHQLKGQLDTQSGRTGSAIGSRGRVHGSCGVALTWAEFALTCQRSSLPRGRTRHEEGSRPAGWRAPARVAACKVKPHPPSPAGAALAEGLAPLEPHALACDQSPPRCAWDTPSADELGNDSRARRTSSCTRRRFEQAIEDAGAQGAKALELRAAASVGRLWQAQGKAPKPAALPAPALRLVLVREDDRNRVVWRGGQAN
jgi:hypothetical protein